jgi:hypothetical protein
MGEEIKNVNAKVDELEAAAKKYASKDTVISIGGYEFTPAKLLLVVYWADYMEHLKCTKTTWA